jgi:hypothetical protein
MSAKVLHAFVALTALAGACAASGCVSDRPSRNGVFNENQYLRKSFLVRPDEKTADTGWFMKATITKTSTPNPLGGINLFQGAESSSYNVGGAFVRWDITSDKVRLVNMREVSGNAVVADQGSRTGEIVNAWPITNVDLKYRINLDGEKTNFYEENQELDWKSRQWIKLNFAKNDLSDLAPFGPYVNTALGQCTNLADSSATLIPDSLVVDEAAGYLQWENSITIPVQFSTADADTCRAAFGLVGTTFEKAGRANVTINVLFSMVRPEKVATPGYKSLELGEKDPIRRKYGAFEVTPIYRDFNTGLVGAHEYVARFNPDKDIVYYLGQGMPEVYRKFFTDPKGVVDQTNEIFAAAGMKGKLVVLNYNDDKVLGDAKGPARRLGDIRYNHINWHTDLDAGPDGLGGIAQFFVDPRTGEMLSASVNVWERSIRDSLLARLDFYLQTIGAETLLPNGEFDDSKLPNGGNCKDGDVIPLVPTEVQKTHNGGSTVYAKMQTYLQKPIAQYGKLGPADFIVPQDTDFFNAFFAVIPYQTYADPDANYFVTPEGGTGIYAASSQWAQLRKVAEFNKMAGQINRGEAPFDADPTHNGLQNSLAFLAKYKELSGAVSDYNYMKQYNHGSAQFDDIAQISYLDVFGKNARQCVGGKFEDRTTYVNALIESSYKELVLHEFGHNLGLRHNFMGSVDQRNFAMYKDGSGKQRVGLYSSSVMDYNVAASSAFFRNDTGGPGWGQYDKAAIAWIYANSAPSGDPTPSLSGQSSSTSPWKDPLGFKADGKTEISYLFCTDEHIRYTPLCRQFDLGTTPSEIIAAEIDNYEWQYRWSNFRLYRKFWSEANYAQNVAGFYTNLRRIFSLWKYDWSNGELTDTLRRIGIVPPPNAPAATYYAQLETKFNTDISMASQMVATFHQAIVQQSSGERPYKTVYDNYHGDVVQQGIIVDKLQAIVNFTSLFETTDFDPDQAQGLYNTAYGGSFGDAAYQTVAEGAVESMVGGQYDIFSFYRPTAVADFAKATHDVNFTGRTEVRDWIGGKVFFRERDFLDFIHGLAVKSNKYGCTTLDNCTYDPRLPRGANANDLIHSDAFNEFVGPEGRNYIWAYIANRNEYVLVDRDRNTASYIIVKNWTNAIVNGEADGSGANAYDPYGLELPMKYFLDSFNQFN